MNETLKKFVKNVLGIDKKRVPRETTKQLLRDNKRKINEVYWGLVFNNSIADSPWLLKKQFNPGRWAAGYPLLYILYRIYNDIKPTNILEFGLGESTKLAYQYNQANPQSKLTVIEQDSNWLHFFSEQIHNIAPNTILLDMGKRSVKGYTVQEYTGLIEKISGQKFDLISIDGPYGSNHYSRHQVVDMIENDLVADDFIIILDDYERRGERETGTDIKKTLKRKNKSFEEGVYSGEKDSLIVCSPKYKFLCSL